MARNGVQQTVKLAIDCETEELFPAERLLVISEQEFTALRRSAMEARIDRRKGGTSVRFKCAICKRPLFLSRHRQGPLNRWFVHDGKADECPWHEQNRLSPDQTKALIYRGQQEGAAHREIKNFLAHWLEKNPEVSNTSREQTTFSEVVKGEWRRPDVKCLYRGMPLVFEVQLSYTFLSDVIARDEFYRREKIFVIWVFSKFELNRAAVTDEAFFNKRNLFILDTEAIQKTKERGTLTFSGYRQAPQLVDDFISDVWTSEPVALSDTIFPCDNYRPFFFEYEATKAKLEAERLEARRNHALKQWSEDAEKYLDAVACHCMNDYDDETKNNILSQIENLKQSHFWHRGYEVLQDDRLYGWHGVLAILLSIRLNKTVGYSPSMSIFQVIEAGLRKGHPQGSKHSYAILFLWAYKIYRPVVTSKNHKWLVEYAENIKESIEAGEDTYLRYEGYDEAIALLFPELASQLESSFGCGTTLC